MKPIYECEWCSFRGTEEQVRAHEKLCKYSPNSIEIQEIREKCPFRKVETDDFYTYYWCEKKRSALNQNFLAECDGGLECEIFLKNMS